MWLSKERLIAAHFWKTTISNRAVRWLLVFVGIGSAYAAVTGWLSLHQHQQIQTTYQQKARHDWLNNPDKHPHRMAHYGHFAFRSKTPLSLFDVGVDSYLGNAIFLEAHRQNAVNFSEAGFSTGLLRFGEISLAMVLQLLFPLLIFFLGFGSVAADRENGTLRLLLSQGVSWQQLIVGKSLGIMSVVMTLFVPIMSVTAGLWVAAQEGIFSEEETLRLLLLIGFYLGYTGLFSVVAVLVSAYSQTARTALIGLIGLWLMLTIVLPRASQALGAAVYATPSKVRFQSNVQADILQEGDSHNPADPHYKALKDSVLAAYGVDSVQQLPINYSGLVMTEGEKITAEIYTRHFDQLQTTFGQQNRFTRAMAFLNPYLAMRNLSMALAGTDYAGYVDFQRQAETYRYAMAQQLNALQIRYISNVKPKPTEKDHSISNTYWQTIPDFHYQARPVSAVFVSEGLSMLAVLFWALVLLSMFRFLTKTLTAY